MKIKKNKILYILILPIFFLYSCGAIKEGFGSKKNSTEEFLVEKKSPLVMPPDFDELPMPKEAKEEEKDDTGIKSLITNNSSNKDQTKVQNEIGDQSVEGSIIEKIQNN